MSVFRTVRQTFTRRPAAEMDVESQQQAHPMEPTAAQSATTAPRPFLPLPFFASSGGRTRQEAAESSPRPASSHYSNRNRQHDSDSDSSMAQAVMSPKTPQAQDFPSQTTPSIPAPVAAPPAAVLDDDRDRNRQRGRRHRRWFHGADPAEVHLAELADAGRRRRERRERRRGGGRQSPEEAQASDAMAGATTREGAAAAAAAAATTTETPSATKPFLFCLPPVRSRRMRAHIVRCVVSGLFVVFLLAVYAGLSVTHNVTNSEFSVLLVLVLVAAAVVFVHSLVRVGLFLAHPPTAAEEAAAEARYQQRRRGPRSGGVGDGPAALGFGAHYGAGGYALPREPIRVVLARDEEVAGAASEAAKLQQPPAYGLWRESVRVDPNRLYWQRNDAAAAAATTAAPGALGAIAEDGDGEGRRRSAGAESFNARPPSYASDDGVQYVVEAQPRSIAPTTDVPLPPHPAEAGRTGGRPAW